MKIRIDNNMECNVTKGNIYEVVSTSRDNNGRISYIVQNTEGRLVEVSERNCTVINDNDTVSALGELIPSASESLKRTQKVKEERIVDELKEVNLLISEQIEKGQYEVTVYGGVSKEIQDILKKKGYKLTRKATGLNEWGTSISWGE